VVQEVKNKYIVHYGNSGNTGKTQYFVMMLAKSNIKPTELAFYEIAKLSTE